MSITKDKATAIRNDVVRLVCHALGLHEQEAVILAEEITYSVAKRLSGVYISSSMIK